MTPGSDPNHQPLASESAESARAMAWPGMRRVFSVLWRAARLKCPHCGRGPVLEHWFKMRMRCGNCGLAIERGERDYFIGSMLFNLVVSELLFAAGFVATLLIAWPNVPWDTLQWAAPLAMGAAPFVLFPFSKLAWLGFDILLRPVTPDELVL
ncbi:MAG TPA: hypothetical protein VM076_18380 [Gemmatimonadaceae bacterium]|nr:hypothetical protein [Gemmatimonadaceae bacterium]